MSKATEKQIQQWKQQYGTIYELESEGRFAYIFDPITKLVIIKILMQALQKGSLEYVDALLANCWVGGDESIKRDDQAKIDLTDKVADLIDIPEGEVTFDDNKAVITIEGKSIAIRMATRQDIKYAEERNRANKPLDTQIHLLERIADKTQLDEWRSNTRAYVGLLLAMDKVKDRKYVSLKKL